MTTNNRTDYPSGVLQLPANPAWGWLDERFVPLDAVPLTDRGFRYGMSVFESLLIRNETPIFLLGHLARLSKGCDLHGIPVPKGALAGVDELLRTSGINGFARIYVTMGDGGLTDPPVPRVFVFIEPRAALPRKAYEEGYGVTLDRQTFAPPFPGTKTGNYWSHVEAYHRARTSGAQEILLCNQKNLLISASMANVFLVKDGTVLTPALACGARDGVVREWVFRHAQLQEAALTIRDLENADELFLTNSWLGVMPVREFDGRALPSRSIAEKLHGEYEAELATSAG